MEEKKDSLGFNFQLDRDVDPELLTIQIPLGEMMANPYNGEIFMIGFMEKSLEMAKAVFRAKVRYREQNNSKIIVPANGKVPFIVH